MTDTFPRSRPLTARGTDRTAVTIQLLNAPDKPVALGGQRSKFSQLAFGLGGECACNQASGWRHKRGGTPPAEPRNHHKASTTAAPNAPIPSAVPVNAMFEGSSMNC